ncbi:hypothetical protein GDO78_005289 [Eleutherodactylus coqui]|uniref:NTR domain-containing protein n=1 Tax=Eleutherodactylus coqui TaxID=57060 RepID=A0A8J6FKW9_ELECQ|nr:hypothetical protein GDO78_005289 [Eleutherodactylus coqui]
MLPSCRLAHQCLATVYAVLVLLITPAFSQVQRTPIERGFLNWFGPEHSLPLRSSNEWGSWQSWSPCSRTCGGGAAVRTRQCIKRDSAGPDCPGDTRQYQVCNMKDCPSGVTDFRHFQCSAYNNKPLMGNYYRWLPFQSGQGDCELSCLAQGQNFYYNFGRVLDGTSCHAEYNGICINGQCLKVGCDLILGSDEKTDICGVCGGQNVSCQHHRNIYTTKYPASGLFGYNEVTMIPAGATNIRVTDKSNNYLALRNRNYHYVINGNWAISFPGVFNVAGTKVQYKRSADNQESFEATGPTDEDLHVMIRFLIADKCGKCRKVKGRQNKIKQYCQKDFVFRGRIVSKKIVGKETCYDVQVIITYKNKFPIMRREYMWVPNTCDCPSLLEKREYILMARRHVNYEKTLNRILLERDSFVRLYKPKEDKMLRDLDKECAKSGYQTNPKPNQ